MKLFSLQQGVKYGLQDIQHKMKNKSMKMMFLFVGIILSFFLISMNIVSADASNQTVCCEKTTSNLYCQNVPANQCDSSSQQAPTSCASTSFCSPGTCYDTVEGTCLDNTPEITCNANNGIWSQNPPAQCNLGCCLLGDQAAYTTLTRCKYLSSTYGLNTNYDPSVTSEDACIAEVQDQDQGACVYTDTDLQTTCRFTTRGDCSLGFNDTNTGATTQFYKNTLCTDPTLGTNCAPTTKTTCVPGKDGVYFVDSCGNPANIYDASMINDQNYWTTVQNTLQSCNPNSENANSPTCGNCNYLQGSICRQAYNTATPSYRNYICQDLNCPDTSNGQSYKQGESWCVYNDKGGNGNSSDAVGSEFFEHICENGQEILEPCAGYRQQVCIQSSINVSGGSSFSQAGCVVNRWQDCMFKIIKQTVKIRIYVIVYGNQILDLMALVMVHVYQKIILGYSFGAALMQNKFVLKQVLSV